MDLNFRSKGALSLTFLVSALLLLVGCELTVTVDVPPVEPTYVLNSIFSPDSLWKVNLSKSKSVLDEDPYARVDDATVTIRDEHDVTVETLRSTGYGNYQGSTRPMVGKRYKIEASFNDNTVVKSVSSAPSPVGIISAKAEDSDLELVFQDPAGVINYYMIKVVKESKRVVPKSPTSADTIRLAREDYIDPNDPSLEYGYFEASIMLNDRVFDGQLFLFKAQLANPPDTRVYLFSISEEYYNYYMQVGLQKKSKRDAFAQPVQVTTNIENGWGVFGGFSAATKSLK